MISESKVDCVYLTALLGVRHPQLFKALKAWLLSQSVVVRILDNVKDIWARDFAPIQVADNALAKFRYAPDYLQGHEHLLTGDDVLNSFGDLGLCHRSEIVLDGGNAVGCRGKVILTDKIYRENPSWDRPRLRKHLEELFRVDHFIVIPKEPYDPVGHADGMVRFIDERAVLVNDYSGVDPAFGDRLFRVLRQAGLGIETLPYSHDRQSREGIPSSVGSYINFLRTGKTIVVPVYGTACDEIALERLAAVFPDVPVCPLPSTTLAGEGGVLNCVSATYRLPPRPVEP